MEGAVSVCALCVMGSMISMYAIYVEHMSHNDPGYVAMCDISEEVSCSKVLSGEYGKILSKFGIVDAASPLDYSNAALGLVYYLCMMLISLFGSGRNADIFRLLMATAAIIFSCYLAYLLAFVIKDLCLVCVSSYVVNVSLFVACLRSVWRREMASIEKKA